MREREKENKELSATSTCTRNCNPFTATLNIRYYFYRSRSRGFIEKSSFARMAMMLFWCGNRDNIFGECYSVSGKAWWPGLSSGKRSLTTLLSTSFNLHLRLYRYTLFIRINLQIYKQIHIHKYIHIHMKSRSRLAKQLNGAIDYWA